MKWFKTFGLVGLCSIGFLATLDIAFELGGSAVLADICMSILEGNVYDVEKVGMLAMAMEIKPVPLIVLSLVATTAAIFALTRDHQRMLAGKSEPDDAERAAILSGMLLVAVARGQMSREELQDVFRIVTGHSLSRELVDFVYDRFKQLSDAEQAQHHLTLLGSSIGRRRTLSAAMMLGSAAKSSVHITASLVDRIATDIGATPDDILVARNAVENWHGDCPLTDGVSPVTVFRHRALELAPA